MFVILGVWYTNIYNTGYLPINSNKVFDHFGEYYNVTRTLDERGLFDAAKYAAYSPAYMAAGNLVVYAFFFAIYSATISYAAIYHRHEIMMGFRNLFRGGKTEQYTDVHNRLMAAYPEGKSFSHDCGRFGLTTTQCPNGGMQSVYSYLSSSAALELLSGPPM